MVERQPAFAGYRTRPTHRPLALAGAAIVVIMLLACVATLPYTLGASPAGPARYEVTRPELGLLPPSWAPHESDERDRVEAYRSVHDEPPRVLLGTDKLGRDLLTRCLAGGGVSLGIGVAAAAIAVIIGTIYGTIAGACGGRVDAVLMRGVDVLYGLPYILLVVLLAVAVDGLIDRLDARVFEAQESARAAGTVVAVPAWLTFVQGHRSLLNVVTLLAAIGGVSWLTMARVVRGQVLSLKERPFMEACRAIGVSPHRQFTRHLLPNLLGVVTVYATLTVPQAILSESFLSFLGIGVREPLPSWGNLAASGLNELNTVRVRWWLLVWPCLLIGLTLLALNFVGEALRDSVDPRRRWTRWRRAS
jgi:ABC-type dipeptide/oligopeptide/nickel transport system permease subunit